MTRQLSTREMLRAEHHLQIEPGAQRWRRAVCSVLGVVLMVLAGVVYWQQGETQAQRLQTLAVENQQLKARLGQLDLLQRESEAAQAQLVRRNGDLAAQVKKLKTDLAFYRQQRDR